ncbi:hypothetical protein Pla163_01320 [Planctomycetes bacterium Pla163]|uniref:Uncharacterized protein n=1 Tax=Rohdeia mirabilis TaxID=2528008 RepID=A0A518CUY3_9BACT|nr:hypothetical protein Pla163_01320 [Planctomycetes bacterium Pla163]
MCLHDTDVSLSDCLDELFAEAEEAKEEAMDVFDARIELCTILGDGAYDPDVDPEDFDSGPGNTYWPLVVGRTLVFEASTDEGLERIEVSTLDETLDVAGFDCRVVRDVVTLEGELVEDTFDWYSTRENGDVWYIGEIALNYEDGFVTDIDGSWRTGVDGAKPGLTMAACPYPGQAYRQEFLFGEAEDVARVSAVGLTVTTPAGTFMNCIETEEWTPLEPGVYERKFYAPGIGFVKEIKPATGQVLELVEIVEP